VVGAGVVGLSIARQLAGQGHSVAIVDRRESGKEASWAGAGLLPAANQDGAIEPLEELRGYSHRLFPEWSNQLFEETGVDNEFENSGGIHLARNLGEASSLRVSCHQFQEEGIVFDPLRQAERMIRFPFLSQEINFVHSIYIPGESTVRNTRHLEALKRSCQLRGVQFFEHQTICNWQVHAGRVEALACQDVCFHPGQICIAAGAWSQLVVDTLLDSAGFEGKLQRPEIEPIRGQLVLLDAGKRFFATPVNEGIRYLVPRRDGLVLVGATVEEAGFDKSTSTESLEDLRQFAIEVVPRLESAKVVKTWAGLRPASVDRLPYLGPIPGLVNAYLASGHYRSGLHLSPATALLMEQLICGDATTIDLHPFRVDRA